MPDSETDLIQKYLAPLAAPAGLGLADDAACLMPSPGMELVLTADAIVEGTHFLSGDPPADIAAKAIAVNLSDLTAKGAAPLGYLVALVLPQVPKEEWFAGFAKGLSARAHGRILGGDLAVGGNAVSISVTAIGEVPHGRMVRRSGARVGDRLFVTGPIGTKAAGLRVLADPAWTAAAGESGLDELAAEYRAPAIPFNDIYARIIRDNASAAMDVSDGLLIDLERLCAASGTGARIEADAVPLHKAVRSLIERGYFSREEAFTGGDDYVCLFAVPPQKADALAAAGGIARCHPIGEIVPQAGGVVIADAAGSPMAFAGRHGYDHFSGESEE